jgi:hypothetical protein
MRRLWKQLPRRSTGFDPRRIAGIDPRTANTIYAGTFYLPYKSVTVAKLEVDQERHHRRLRHLRHRYRSARSQSHHCFRCSGIYESKNAGESWRKVQGIPSQSRRTRAILQHPRSGNGLRRHH